jgi:hypothetical protein
MKREMVRNEARGIGKEQKIKGAVYHAKAFGAFNDKQ